MLGIEANSIARMEAYDAEGNYLFRSNSPPLQVGETSSLRLDDGQSRIARVRIFGHARTEVALGRLEFGPRWEATSGKHGVIRLENLPDGVYEVLLEPELVIHQPAGEQISEGTVQITVSGEIAPELAIPIRRVDSPWLNPNLAEDVDQNGNVEPLDALRIINDLNRNGSRNLRGSEFDGAFIDTNNDGWVTPADALSVINSLNRQIHSGQGESVTSQTVFDASPTPPAPHVSATNPAVSTFHPPHSTREGEGDRRSRARADAEQGSFAHAAPAVGAIDQIFTEFAAEPSGVTHLEPIKTVEDDADNLHDPNNQKPLLHPFFAEPIAGSSF